jgi:hypothetical protein
LFFIGITFYVRRKQINAIRSFGFNGKQLGGDISAAARGYANEITKLNYVGLSCSSAEVKGAECHRCGSKM